MSPVRIAKNRWYGCPACSTGEANISTVLCALLRIRYGPSEAKKCRLFAYGRKMSKAPPESEPIKDLPDD